MECLWRAARDGDLATIKRLRAEGVDVTEHGAHGVTAIMVAARHDHSTVVKFLQAAGASVVEKDDTGCSAVHYAAMKGNLSLVQYFYQEAGASISDVTVDGETVWDLLRLLDLHDVEPVALASLLKVMLMLGYTPPAFAAKLSPAHAELATRGRHFRVQLLLYLEQQRASVFENCPLPPVLLPIVAGYAATTSDDMWTDGLRVQAPRPKRP
jgi:hypothetical protein